MKWPDDLREFIDSVEWVFARTYAKTWPHEYIVKERVDQGRFEQVVQHIRERGQEGRFYRRRITYLYADDALVYWTMVPPVGTHGWYPVDEETIVNRCPRESTYEYRLANGTLPDRSG